MSDGMPIQSDGLPHFDQNLKGQIEKHLSGLPGLDTSVSDGEWSALKSTLSSFKQDTLYWYGFLKAGEVNVAKRITKNAKKLADDLVLLDKAGLVWLIQEEVAPQSIDDLLGTLRALARLDLGSPGNHGAMKKVIPEALERLRSKLQLNLDRWWQHVTGTTPLMEDEEQPRSPYSIFLEHVFSVFPPELVPGISRAAVHKRRAYEGRRNREMAEKSKLVGLALSKLSR